MAHFRIGTRGSPLALWQAHFVAGELRAKIPDVRVELVEIQTTGDRVTDVPLTSFGGEGVFTKAIQDALLSQRVDIAVHSLKDLPTVVIPGLTLASVPPRGPTGDALVSHKWRRFDDLPLKATVATSSLRRRAQLLHRRPDLNLVEIRGNVDTRLRKLVEHDFDATILAEAGLIRLGLERHIAEVLDATWMLPAVGQGALGIECRSDDAACRAALAVLDDTATHSAVLAERALLRRLGGGCHMPVGARGIVNGDELTLHAAVVSPDGTRRLACRRTGQRADCETLGIDVGTELLSQGAEEILNLKGERPIDH